MPRFSGATPRLQTVTWISFWGLGSFTTTLAGFDCQDRTITTVDYEGLAEDSTSTGQKSTPCHSADMRWSWVRTLFRKRWEIWMGWMAREGFRTEPARPKTNLKGSFEWIIWFNAALGTALKSIGELVITCSLKIVCDDVVVSTGICVLEFKRRSTLDGWHGVKPYMDN